MSSFATELAQRLTSHHSYWENFLALQSAGAASTLPDQLERTHATLAGDEVVKLLYCASVFAQTDQEKYKGMAQAIALNSLFFDTEHDIRERCIRVLTELGNFPGLSYAETHYEIQTGSLLGLLQRRVSQELNTVDVGDERLALTDFQKDVWDALPNSSALAISAPTSAGKSFLVIEHLCRLTTDLPKFAAVYVAPTRALLSEVHQSVTLRLSGVEGVRISSVPSLDPDSNPKQVFIVTQERLQVLLSITDMVFDLVVVDEAQNLSDGTRGMILQECLEQLVQRNRSTRVIMLAPGAEGFSDAASVIGIPELKPASTTVSPVLQNRILVSKVAGKDQLLLRLLTPKGAQQVGVLPSKRGFDIPATRLASVALELGSKGGSLVYATGPSGAEDVADQLSQEPKIQEDPRLEELATFIEEHIHPEYKLASMVRRGVAFHYGKMPTLLRESLERAFKSGAIQFLACTTTLFQGVNLPARNVFIDTPTRGSGTILDPALLWNFAGRAGRMRKDVVGNVFLVDYDEWPEQPMNEFVRFQIRPALQSALLNSYDKVVDALEGNMPRLSPRDDTPARVRASAGLLIARAAKGDVQAFARRILPDFPDQRRLALAAAAEAAAKKLELPASILTSNWMIDPFGQKRLYDRIVEKIRDDEIDDLIPLNPHDKGASSLYGGIFSRILKAIYGQNGNFGGYVAGLAIPWMKGVPYPVILAKAIRKAKERAQKQADEKAAKKLENPKLRIRAPKPVNTNKVIREIFDIIEDVVRFQFVQLGKVYIDLLALALRNEGRTDLVPTIFDFSLALEIGIATTSGRSFIQLGLSRIAASALEQLYPNSNLSTTQARDWLRGLDVEATKLSPVIVEEIRLLRLLEPLRENG